MEPNSDEWSSTADSGSDFDRSKYKSNGRLEIRLTQLLKKPESKMQKRIEMIKPEAKKENLKLDTRSEVKKSKREVDEESIVHKDTARILEPVRHGFDVSDPLPASSSHSS
jgi:hypothetical protein